MQSAFDELASFTGALQLTPGNHPTERFDLHLTAPSRQPHARRTLDSRIATRRHHGFDFARTRVPVWSSDARCLVASDSVHPPMLESDAAFSVVRRGIEAWLGEVMTDGRQPVGVSTSLLETMYPGYVLGNGAEIETAMDIGVHLAVDVSHVFIQLSQGDMTERTWRRLQDYDHVGEVHVSANDGRRDIHVPVTASTFGLAWARERLSGEVPVVVECYMHRLTQRQREEQVELLAAPTG